MRDRLRSVLAATGTCVVLFTSTVAIPAHAAPAQRVNGTPAAEDAPALPRGDSVDTIGPYDSDRKTLHYRISRAPGERVVLGAVSGRGTEAGYLRMESATASGLDCAQQSFSASYARGSGAFEPFGDCVNDTEVVVAISRGSKATSDQELLLRNQSVPVPVNQVPASLPELQIDPDRPETAEPLAPGPGPFEAAELPADAAVSGTLQPDSPAYFKVKVGWGQQLNVSAFAPVGAPDGGRVSLAVYDPALQTVTETRSKLAEAGIGRTTKPVMINNFEAEKPTPYLAGDYIVEIVVSPNEGDPPAAAVDYVLTAAVLGNVTGVPVTAEEQAAQKAKQLRQRIAIGFAAAGGALIIASAVLFVRRRP